MSKFVFRNRAVPEPDDDVWRNFHRCDACGSFNETATRPEGGKFEPVSTTETINGESVEIGASLDGGNGCWFCGCPEHRRGGKLGDMDHPF